MRGRRETPEQRELRELHRRSVARSMSPPKGLQALTAWLVEGFRAEIPDELHASGVWRDWARDRREAVGGSLLGSPQLADGFRRLLEGSPFATEPSEYEGHKSRDGDDHFVTPMRAALASLAGRGAPDEPSPFMARVLYRTALFGGDWDAACASMGIIEPVRRTYVESALVRLYRRYSISPPARPVGPRQDDAVA